MTSHLAREGCRIAYQVSGNAEGPAVVFTHSLGLDSSSWDAQAALLGERYRTVQVDLRGHGQSDAPRGGYTVEGLATDVLAVVDHLGIGRFHSVGLSIGGMTALWLAIHRGDRLLSAAFCNTAARLGSAELWNARIAAVRAGGMESIAEQVVARFFSESFAARAPALVARARATLAATDPEGYAGCCAALSDEDLRGDVERIRVPSLVVGSEEDAATPPAQARWLHAKIAGSELVLLERAGHVSNLEEPAAFGEALAAHLKKTPG